MAEDQLTSSLQFDHLLVIGGSAGSLAMVLKIVPFLKQEMNVCVVLVFHRKTDEHSILQDVLSNRTQLEVREIEDKDEITSGVVYVAPADYHVLIEKDGTITLDFSEKINHSRPSIDITFETSAEAFSKRVTCLLLSGANADGVEGLVRAKELGARVAIQDPAIAEVPFMPQQALDRMRPDMILTYDNVQDLIRHFY